MRSFKRRGRQQTHPSSALKTIEIGSSGFFSFLYRQKSVKDGFTSKVVAIDDGSNPSLLINRSVSQLIANSMVKLHAFVDHVATDTAV